MNLVCHRRRQVSMDLEYKSFIKIFITGCLWGTIGLFVKLMEAQGSSSPYTSFLRLLFGFILLALMTLIIDGPKAFCIGRRTLLSCVLLGIICQGIFNILYSTSISMNGMSVGSVLLYTAPIFTCITSMLLFKEKMDLLKWVALLVNVVGCALTATCWCWLHLCYDRCDWKDCYARGIIPFCRGHL